MIALLKFFEAIRTSNNDANLFILLMGDQTLQAFGTIDRNA